MRSFVLTVTLVLFGCDRSVEATGEGGSSSEGGTFGSSVDDGASGVLPSTESSESDGTDDDSGSMSGGSSVVSETDESTSETSDEESTESGSTSGDESTEDGSSSDDESSSSSSGSDGGVSCEQFAPCNAPEDCCPAEPEDFSICFDNQCIVYTAGPLAITCDFNNLAEQCPGVATCYYYVHEMGAPDYCCMPPDAVCNVDSDCCFGTCESGACNGAP